MPTELPRPDLADTPELFDRIEANLRNEAVRIREHNLARRRRRSWFEHLRPVMSAGAAIAAAVVLFPLAQAPEPAPTPVSPPSSIVTPQRSVPAVEAAPTANVDAGDAEPAPVVELPPIPLPPDDLDTVRSRVQIDMVAIAEDTAVTPADRHRTLPLTVEDRRDMFGGSSA